MMLKIRTKSYFYYEHSKFGRLKFRKINLNDLTKIENYKVIGKRYKGFTIFVLHNQIVSPKIGISDFSILDNKEIISIAKYFMKETGGIFAEYFNENENESFFLNFYNSFKKRREELSKSFVPIGKVMSQMSIQISKFLPNITSQLKIAPMTEIIMADIKKSWQKIVIATEDAGRILEKYGWLIPPSIDIRVATLISNLGNKPGNHREKINKLFLDYYQRDNFKEIELVIKGWKSNKLFRRRIKILKDCLKTIQLSKEIGAFNSANVIIPTLIAQIDGVWTDYAISKGFDIRKYAGREFNKELNKHKKEIITKLKTSDSFVKLDDLFKNMVLETLWGTAYPRQCPKTGYIKTRFNRHKIMHGEYVSYGSIYNVLRAFFLLDFISELK